MASVNPLLSGLSATGTVRDYKHGSRTFVDNNFELQPRYSNLFHVVFEFTPDASTLFNTVEQLEIPILVKSVDLPAYTIDVQTHNQYNRRTQSHHRIDYQPITVRFHDDQKEVIRNMWHKYYIFYNADPTYSLDSNSYTTSDKYTDRVQQQWGLQRGNKRFFKSIKIYSMHNHKFAEYTLINPIITSFQHDAHAYANGSLMEHTMQVAYETVKYATGYVNDITPRGFADIHYDVETSDLSNNLPDNQAFIDGSLRSIEAQPSRDLFQGNVIGVIKDADIIYDQTKPATTGNIITDTIAILANNALTGKKLSSNILVPVAGKIESIVNNVGNSQKKTLKGIENSVTSYFKPDAQGQNPQQAVITSQGTNIQTTNTTARTTQNDVGGATIVPAGNGTVSNPGNMGDVITSFRKGLGIGNNRIN